MNIEAIVQAPMAVKIHLATVLPAFAIGTWQRSWPGPSGRHS
jgi:uncharacterized membrane protein